MKNILLAAALLFMMLGYSGCSITRTLYPASFQETTAIYADKSGLAGGSYKVGNQELNPVQTFEAGYDDVFQALKIGTTQALLLVKDYSEDEGVILAERTIQVQGLPWKYSYVFFVEESGPDTVTIYAASQRQRTCLLLDHGAGWDIATVGVATATKSVANQCKDDIDDRTGDFAFDTVTSEKVMAYTANNLIAAGVL